MISQMDNKSKVDKDADTSVLYDLDQKEKELSRLLISGMENY